MTEAAPAAGAIDRLKLYYERNEQKVAILSFICGFFFDILTVERADSWYAIGQQVLYLAVILAALTQMFLEEGKPPLEAGTVFAVKRWYYQYRTAIIHFFLGTLLNVYTIFFFKSSSLLVSFAFLAFLVFLLWANESARFKSLGLSFKFTLLSLCMLCFSANVVPIFVGSIGLVVFLLSMFAGCLPLVGVVWWLRRRSPDLFPRARRQMLVPLGAVLVGFLVFYFFRLIPPVPLSIPFIGIYHAVEKTQDTYRLSHERPAWRICHSFLRPGAAALVFEGGEPQLDAAGYDSHQDPRRASGRISRLRLQVELPAGRVESTGRNHRRTRNRPRVFPFGGPPRVAAQLRNRHRVRWTLNRRPPDARTAV